jgi:hypothetical protein
MARLTNIARGLLNVPKADIQRDEKKRHPKKRGRKRA